MHKSLPLAAATLLLLAGCKSSGDESSSTTSPATSAAAAETTTPEATTTAGSDDSAATTSAETTTTAAPIETVPLVPDPRAPGVTDDTIKVGVTYVDLSKIKDIIHIDHGDYEAAYTALFDDLNARGGIAGRKLEPIFAPVDPTAQTSSDDACTKLTQDEQVFVAIGFFRDDDVLCFVSTNETPVIGGTMTAERIAQAKAPWYSPELGGDLETGVIREMAETGQLDGPLAVVGSTPDQQAMDSTIKPLLDELGIDAETAIIDTSGEDTTAMVDAAATLAERFKSSGIEKVLLIGNSATAFGRGLAQTDYRPQLLVTTLSAATTYTADPTNDLSVFEGAIAGSGFGPADARIELPGVTKTCLDVQRAAGLEIPLPSSVPDGEPVQAQSSLNACFDMVLLEDILTKVGTELNFGTFRAAGDNLGSVDIPGFKDPLTFGPPPHADGDPAAYLYKWDAATADFVRLDG